MLPVVSQFLRLKFSFTPRLFPTLAALIAVGLTLYLATWQQGRAVEKRVLQAKFDERVRMSPIKLDHATVINADQNFRYGLATGEYDVAGQFFVDNKMNGTTVGYHVFTPLQLLSTKKFVLVNRGFVGRGTTYPTPPMVAVPPGVIVVTGMLVSPNRRFLELGKLFSEPAATTGPLESGNMMPSVQGNVWQNITIDRYRAKTGRDVLPLVLLASPTDAGLIAQRERPDARVEKHVEYMLTWYSLAATVVILWLVLNFKIARPPN